MCLFIVFSLYKNSIWKNKKRVVLHPWRDCKRILKWPSIQRWQCLIHNGTLETFIWSIMWKIFCFFYFMFNSENLFFCSRNAQFNYENSEFKIFNFQIRVQPWVWCKWKYLFLLKLQWVSFDVDKFQ